MVPYSYAQRDIDALSSIQTNIDVSIEKRKANFMDICNASVDTKYFMMTNSYHVVSQQVDLLFTNDNRRLPVIPFTQADMRYCLDSQPCVIAYEQSKKFDKQSKIIVQDFDMLFRTDLRDEFCSIWHQRYENESVPVRDIGSQDSLGLLGPTATTYISFLSMRGILDKFYAFTDQDRRNIFRRITSVEEEKGASYGETVISNSILREDTINSDSMTNIETDQLKSERYLAHYEGGAIPSMMNPSFTPPLNPSFTPPLNPTPTPTASPTHVPTSAHVAATSTPTSTLSDVVATFDVLLTVGGGNVTGTLLNGIEASIVLLYSNAFEPQTTELRKLKHQSQIGVSAIAKETSCIGSNNNNESCIRIEITVTSIEITADVLEASIKRVEIASVETAIEESIGFEGLIVKDAQFDKFQVVSHSTKRSSIKKSQHKQKSSSIKKSQHKQKSKKKEKNKKQKATKTGKKTKSGKSSQYGNIMG